MTPQELACEITSCRVCGGPLKEVIDLGYQPIANNLLKHRNQQSPMYKLAVVVCEECHTAQSGVNIPKQELFKNYTYKSSFNKEFVQHFESVAEQIYYKYRPDTLIEIGCNDGIFLDHMEDFAQCYGIDPAQNLITYLQREKKKQNVTCGYIEDPYIYARTHERMGKVDVIYGANVFAHIADMMTAFAHVRLLLKPDGIFIIEVQNLEKLITDKHFDMIYHEHYFYWTKDTITNALRLAGFEVVEIEDIKTHGGSIRVHAKQKLVPPPHQIHSNEKELFALGGEIVALKNKWLKTFNRIKFDGEKVVGYGAPAKATVLLNYFGIDNSYIDYIIDDSELKQGLYMPGTHIPIVKRPDTIDADYVFVLAWNYLDSITESLKGEKVSILSPFTHIA